MRGPGATYRLQLTPGFGFEAARGLVPYLHALGVSDLYTSPILAARKGSMHGYDVIDPTSLNPELGTHQEFAALCAELRGRGMGLLLDIVPNHMAMSSENAWWMDVLEHGMASPYAGTFDIDWHAPGLEGKVLVPILGAPYGETLQRGELNLVLDRGAIFVHYREHRFPLGPRSYRLVLEHRLDRLQDRLGPDHPAVQGIRRLIRTARNVPDRNETDPALKARRGREGVSLKRRLRDLLDAMPEARKFVEANVREWGGAPGTERSVELLDRLIGEQAYLLSYWRVAPEEIDYRRFFDITDLVAVRAEDPEVFRATHRLVLDLVAEGKVTGLRIDHVDGLRDPLAYLRRLQDHLRSAGTEEGGALVVVEKILSPGEELPAAWPVAGTTGYEFLGSLGDLFVDPGGVGALQRFTSRFTGRAEPFEAVALAAKRAVMEQLFGAEVASLAARLQRLARQDRWGRDLTRSELTRALVEVTVALDVYRTYVRELRIDPPDRERLTAAVAAAERELPVEAATSLDFLRRVLTLQLPRRHRVEQARAWLAFVMRWQQFTGPVMAKGVEDTALYVHAPLLSRNEVGSEPGHSPLTLDGFHQRMAERIARWPNGLSATSTHDSKRSEDVRARIAVLSEVPDPWAERVGHWQRWNRRFKREVRGSLAPDPTDELILYQTLIGVWPLQRRDERGFAQRIQEFMIKAIREAKVHTSWVDQEPEYEAAVEGFVHGVLAPSNRRFRTDLLAFQRTVAFHGMLNGLSQVVLKAAAPGVPDFYQGTEGWYLRLVDPDNRVVPDFARAARRLRALEVRWAEDQADLAGELLRTWPDGRIKLLVTAAALRLRTEIPGVFERGSYRAVAATGRRKDCLVAFARRHEEAWVLSAAARWTTRLTSPGSFPLGREVWGPGALLLPDGAPEHWRDALTGRTVEARTRRGRPTLLLAEVFDLLPVALLSAGIVSSRP